MLSLSPVIIKSMQSHILVVKTSWGVGECMIMGHWEIMLISLKYRIISHQCNINMTGISDKAEAYIGNTELL